VEAGLLAWPGWKRVQATKARQAVWTSQGKAKKQSSINTMHNSNFVLDQYGNSTWEYCK
jgi:hypothetical protein